MNGIGALAKSLKNSFSPSTVEDTVRLPSHQNCEKKGIII